jgi:glycerol uptake facilitator-like aquaporin
MAERLASGNLAIVLLANTLATGATGAALVALILNLCYHLRRPLQPRRHHRRCRTGWNRLARSARLYCCPDRRCFQWSGRGAHHVRAAAVLLVPSRAEWGAQLWSEFLATFGLLSVIWGCSRTRPTAVALAVGAYITATYWFTASTSFANPAVTLARAASDTFAGIRPADAPGFMVAQLTGAIAATLLFRWFGNATRFGPSTTEIQK